MILYLRVEVREFLLLNLEGQPVVELPITQITVSSAYYLNAVSVFTPDKTQFFYIVFYLRAVKVQSQGIVNS